MERPKQDWDFLIREISDGRSGLIALDLALIRVAPVSGLPTLFSIRVALKAPGANGMVTAEERPRIDEIEDSLTEGLEAHGWYVAREFVDGAAVFHFHVPSATGMEDRLVPLLAGFSDYEVETKDEPDPDWSYYRRALYPDPGELRTIQGRRARRNEAIKTGAVLQTLRERGDRLDALREIDHCAYFPSEDARRGFAEAARARGFRISHEWTAKRPGEEFPCGIEFCRDSTVIPEAIEQVVSEVFELMRPFEGRYDGWGCMVVKK